MLWEFTSEQAVFHSLKTPKEPTLRDLATSPNPFFHPGIRGIGVFLPSPKLGRGAGGEGFFIATPNRRDWKR